MYYFGKIIFLPKFLLIMRKGFLLVLLGLALTVLKTEAVSPPIDTGPLYSEAQVANQLPSQPAVFNDQAADYVYVLNVDIDNRQDLAQVNDSPPENKGEQMLYYDEILELDLYYKNSSNANRDTGLQTKTHFCSLNTDRHVDPGRVV